jgi:subtilase family serine protease
MKLAALGAAMAACLAYTVGGASSAGAAGPSIVPHKIKVDPLVQGRVAASPVGTFSCQSRPLGGTAPRCYQAFQMENAYNVTPLLDAGKDGTGRTIVIIDAYGSPTMASDLQEFDAAMGLPDPSFSVIAPAGSPPPFDITDDNQFGWSIETTLDVEWAHAIAPGANIVLAVAKSNDDTDIYNVQKYVVDHNIGDVVSQSFGEAEQCMDSDLLAQTHTLFAKAAKKGITVFASSGDSGAAQPACSGDGAVLSASTPASDPSVTGVGGTTLLADENTGAYEHETAWTEAVNGCNPPAVDPSDSGCSGGGFSSVFSRPGFQSKVQKNRARGVPDVAYNAGVDGGVLIRSATLNEGVGLPPEQPTFFIIGGTSAGTPQWSGLAAIGDQMAHHRLGTINPALYAIAHHKKSYARSMHDVTEGNNDVAEVGGGYAAVKGWDPVTGLGTPNAAQLLPALVKRAG